MRPVRVASLVLVGLFALGSCSSPSDPFATETSATDTPRATRRPNRDQDFPPTEAKRPRPGEYVYEIVGIGATQVPLGTVLTEKLSVSGDLVTIDVTNSRNDNTQQIQLRWQGDRVLQLSNDVVVDGDDRRCNYEPPLVLLHNPVRAEDYPKQQWTATTCEKSVEFSVVERTSIKDQKGKAWDVWMIQATLEGRGQVHEETRWFSPELGRDIRIESARETESTYDQTVRILSSYPAPV